MAICPTWPIILAALLLMPSAAFAQGPAGHIAYIYPAGGQAGRSVEVTVGGNDLSDLKGVRITGEGVTGEVRAVDQGKRATLAITIAADAAPGQRDLRLITPGGVTNRARFLVGKIPEVMEKEPNSDLATAQVLPAVPVVVNGQILEADRDCFRFSAKAGQTIVCRVQAQELLPFIADAVPGWCQAVLTLYDAAGNKLAHVDDFRFHPDPVLIYKVERDGDYVVAIQDAVFRGREDFVYRLSIGELPFITSVYPLGARRQAATRLALFGANLPAHELDRTPTAEDPPVVDIEVGRNDIVSNRLPLAVGELPEIEEVEPNNTLEKAQEVTVPATINGRIQEPGDVDCFAFSAEAEQKLILNVDARKLDSPLDSVLTLVDGKGKWLAQNDDTEDESTPMITHHADSRIVYTFKTAGKYVVKIGDIQGKGGPEFAYRLSIAPPRPDFQLRVTPDNPHVGQGATAVLSVQALRRDGFDGPIDLAVENLPSGFTVSGTSIVEGSNETLVTLTAPADVPLGPCRPTVVGTATIGDRKVVRRALPAEDVMQAFIYHHLLPTEEMLLTVLEPAPFKLIPQMPPEGYIRFAEGRTAFVVVKVERKEGVKGPIRLALHNPPKGVRMQGGGNIPANESEVKLEIRIPNELPPTVRYNLIVSGTLKQGEKTLTSISPVILALGPTAKAPGGK